MKGRNKGKQFLAAGMIAVLAFRPAMQVHGSPDVLPCDETLYITMDEYGAISESSVVKSYSTGGHATIVDYGTYGEIVNMTDHSQPILGEDGSVTFVLEKPSDRFYFEGTMDVTKDQLPWNITVSYRLNGVEKKAEELFGAAGLAEINVDLTPNANVSEYYRNNMTLMATAIVDMDKNLSLEAEGTQVQAMGNLNAVVFFALPGETQSYSIRIGTEDFQFNGLVFTMVPLTVAQLDKVADLRDAKETVEDSADAISESLDVVLDTLEGMRQSLSDTADGVRTLDQARQIFSDSKGQVYADADTALDSLYDFSQRLLPFSEDAKNARSLLTELNRDVNELAETLDELSPLLSDLREDIRSLREDVEKLRELINSPAADLGAQSVIMQMEKTKTDLETLKTGQRQLTAGIGGIASALPQLISTTGALKNKTAEKVFSKSELRDLLSEIQDEDLEEEDDVASYLFNEMEYSIDQIDTLVAYLMPRLNIDTAKEREEDDADKEADLSLIASPSDASPNHEKNSTAGRTSAYAIPPEAMGSLSEALNAIVEGTQGTIGNTALTDDISTVIDTTETLLKALAAQKPAISGALKNTGDLAKTAEKICSTADDLISSVDDLNRTVNEHHGELIQTLHDVGDMTDSASTGLSALVTFGTSLENQLKAIGDPLNNGTQRTLNGLAGALSQADAGLSQTAILRNAKNTVKNLIDDKWEEYTAEDTTILNADPDAGPISFTSDKNPPPRTIQVVLRTGEIKEKKADAELTVDESFHPDGNIFHRIANILRRILEAIKGLFSK